MSVFFVVGIIMKNSVIKKILVFVVPLFSVALLYLIAVFVAKYVPLPPCITYTVFHIYCPGCGMTRSVIALLKGEVLLSLRQNIFILLGIIIVFLYYIELIFRVFGKNIRFPIHSKCFLYGLLIFAVVYSLARNFVPILAPI